MTISEDFVTWAGDLELDDVPYEVRQRATIHLLDGIGVALAAARLGSAPFALPVARSLGSSQESTVLGSRDRSSAAGAALANGLLMHSLDFDDTHTAGLVHATVATVPAALSVAERESASGAQLLTAIIAGYEFIGRISRAVPHGFHSKGFHATSVCGTFSSALVASLLSGLTAEQAVNALGIAGSQSSGSLEFLATGASTKQIHAGWASLAGVVAADLAAGGASGPSTILEGEHGLFALYSGVEPDLALITAELGSSWETLGIETKPYPACHLIHRSLDVARQLHSRIDIDDIRKVIVTVPEDSIPIVCAPSEFKRAPRSAYEAKFSVQWSVAAMLLDATVDIDTYDPQRIGRADVARLSQLVDYVPNAGDLPAAEVPGAISVVFTNGTSVSLRSDAPEFGDGGSGDESIFSKFRGNVGASRASTEALIKTVMGIDDAPDLSALTEVLDAVVAEWSRA